MLILLHLLKNKSLTKLKNYSRSMIIHNRNAHPKIVRKKKIQIQMIQIAMKQKKNVNKKRRRKKNIQTLILKMKKRKTTKRKNALQKFLKLRQKLLDINMWVPSPLHLIFQRNLNATELKILRDLMVENLNWKLKNVLLKLKKVILTSKLHNNAELYLKKFGHLRKIVMVKKNRMKEKRKISITTWPGRVKKMIIKFIVIMLVSIQFVHQVLPSLYLMIKKIKTMKIVIIESHLRENDKFKLKNTLITLKISKNK